MTNWAADIHKMSAVSFLLEETAYERLYLAVSVA